MLVVTPNFMCVSVANDPIVDYSDVDLHPFHPCEIWIGQSPSDRKSEEVVKISDEYNSGRCNSWQE